MKKPISLYPFPAHSFYWSFLIHISPIFLFATQSTFHSMDFYSSFKHQSYFLNYVSRYRARILSYYLLPSQVLVLNKSFVRWKWWCNPFESFPAVRSDSLELFWQISLRNDFRGLTSFLIFWDYTNVLLEFPFFKWLGWITSEFLLKWRLCHLEWGPLTRN